MIIATPFELESVKDQIALLRVLSSHIDIDELKTRELDRDYEKLLEKMNKSAQNLEEKYQHLKKLLDN